MRGEISRSKGMTLIEAAIVLGLVAVVSGLAVERFGGTVATWRLQSAAELVAGELTRLRVRAIAALGPSFLQVAEGGESFIAVEADREVRSYRLPRGVRIRAPTSRAITFYSRGSAVPAGSYLLENKAGRIRVIVSPMGRVRWEWE